MKINKLLTITNIIILLFAVNQLSKQINLIDYKINKANNKINNLEIVSKNENIKIPYRYIGKFQASFYCSCKKCVGNKQVVKTAVGNIPHANKTIAVDSRVIPLHSIVYIKGMGFYVAEDTGGAIKGNKIDIYTDNHETALKNGTKKVDIYLLE